VNPDSERAWLATLSPEARQVMEEALARPRAVPPPADDHAAWVRLQAEVEARSRPVCERTLARFAPTLVEREFAGMPALSIQPQQTDQGRAPLLFLHGGGYTTFSARSSLFASVPLAAELRREVIALDYPLAPGATVTTTVPAASRALAGVLTEYPGAALAGDSAGGGLAVAVCNHLLQDSDLRPSSLLLISPWTDLGERGDSRLTLRDHDPVLQWEPGLAACAAAYAAGAVDDPAASPVLADYDAGFPPTLIVCGSREILLSDSLRLYRRLQEAGAAAVLDLHDGLHHSFPVVTPLAPEARQARATMREFLDRYPGVPA